MRPSFRGVASRVFPRVRFLFVVFAVVTAAAILGAAGQVRGGGEDPAAQNQPPVPQPTFRTSINAVLVDVRVTDANGDFVSTLSKDDFQVFEDGVEQSVDTLELVSIPFDPPEGESAPLSPDVRSNTEPSDGRLYAIVLDDLMHPLRGDTMRALATEFIERFVDDRDRVAIMAMSGRRDLAQEFTNDRRLLLETISRYEGGFGEWQTAFKRLESVRALCNWLADVPGRHKGLVLIGANLDPTIVTTAGLMNLIDHQQELRDIVGAAGRGNVSLYYIDPAGKPSGPWSGIRPTYIEGDGVGNVLDMQQRQEYMTALTIVTGGFALNYSNDYTKAFERIVRENSSDHLLSYAAKDPRIDDRFRRLDVRLRSNIGNAFRVRARLGYVTKNARPLTGPRSPRGAAPELAEALQSPLAVSGLEMSFMAAAFRGSGNKATVPVVVEVREGDSSRAAPDGKVDLIIAAADVKTTEARSTQRGSLENRENGSGRFLSTLELKPGRYHVRVAGLNGESGNRGSVTYDLDVPDFSKQPLTMSGMVIASAATATLPTLGYDNKWRDLLGAPGTTTRRFIQGDELRHVVEVYDNDRKAAGPVEVRTVVRNSAGATIFGRRQLFVRDSAGDGAYRVSTTIPLGDNAPGDYVLSVEARAMDGRPPVTRSVPFALEPATR